MTSTPTQARAFDPKRDADVDLVVIHEHPQWQEPLFAALDARDVNYRVIDLKSASFDPFTLPTGPVYFNQASPSGYVRGNHRAAPLNLSLLRCLEQRGARVLNGADAFAFELSKSEQVAFLQRLQIDSPHSVIFNDVKSLANRDDLRFPALLKPEQGGSGAGMHRVESLKEVEELLANPEVWEPSKVLLLQEFCPSDEQLGIVRMEFLGGELLYAMRVLSDGGFNNCPSEVCNPVDGELGACALPEKRNTKPTEFLSYKDVPAEAVEAGRRIVAAAGLDLAGIEYLETADGRRVFFDINANSNLRGPIGEDWGFDPFAKVVDFLQTCISEHYLGLDSSSGSVKSSVSLH